MTYQSQKQMLPYKETKIENINQVSINLNSFNLTNNQIEIFLKEKVEELIKFERQLIFEQQHLSNNQNSQNLFSISLNQIPPSNYLFHQYNNLSIYQKNSMDENPEVNENIILTQVNLINK